MEHFRYKVGVVCVGIYVYIKALKEQLAWTTDKQL